LVTSRIFYFKNSIQHFVFELPDQPQGSEVGGRDLRIEEDHQGDAEYATCRHGEGRLAHPLALISHGFWRKNEKRDS
jgi:hypothetical protein